MKFFTWFAGFFEDQMGSASSKRATLYIFCFFFWMQVKGSLEGRTFNEYILYTTVLIILFCVGAITVEFFKEGIKIFDTNKKVTITETKEQNKTN